MFINNPLLAAMLIREHHNRLFGGGDIGRATRPTPPRRDRWRRRP
jgi:hypothetical protein